MDKFLAASKSLETLMNNGRRKIEALLESRPGHKSLFLDQELAGLLTLLLPVTRLKERDVQRISYLESQPLQIETEHLVFLVQPRVELVHLIALQVFLNHRKCSKVLRFDKRSFDRFVKLLVKPQDEKRCRPYQ
mmetsp:Transcript_23389/g.79575  ORF Transcript_23389/g.79575 Transcript_23389/m.79575 type:complete len:134 (-) Transcript_23389:2616-3017(-)